MGAGPGCVAGLRRGRPASRPRRELRSAARRVGSVRCPDAQLWLSTSNSARNSSTTDSNIEFASLELQRFWGISKNDRDQLRTRFGWRWRQRRPLRPSAPRAVRAASRPRRALRSALLLVVRPDLAGHGHSVLRAPPPGLPISPVPSAPAGPGPCGPSGALHAGGGGDFALHEAVRGRVVGVSDPHVVQIPPFGDGEITV